MDVQVKANRSLAKRLEGSDAALAATTSDAEAAVTQLNDVLKQLARTRDGAAHDAAAHDSALASAHVRHARVSISVCTCVTSESDSVHACVPYLCGCVCVCPLVCLNRRRGYIFSFSSDGSVKLGKHGPTHARTMAHAPSHPRTHNAACAG